MFREQSYPIHGLKHIDYLVSGSIQWQRKRGWLETVGVAACKCSNEIIAGH
tara:strand:- start:23531 stop:23683 length:153 start_codon:yes stop_codon:yes gene_type:complete